MPDQTTPDKEEILQLIETGDLEVVQASMEEYHPADIADLLDDMPTDEAVIIFGGLPLEVASEVLDETGGVVRAELIDRVNDEKLADLLEELPMDDAAELLEELPEDMSARLLKLMEPEEAEEVREILSYQDETAGRLMTTDVAALRRQWTAAEAIDYLRAIEDLETLHYLYVVDRNGRLIGVVPIRFLLLANADEIIEDIMLDSVFSVRASADQEELAEFIARYDYTAIPVVSDDNRLLGVVTVDDALDVLEEEATEDIQRLGGSEPLDQPYASAPILAVAGKRIGWLMLLFATGTLTGGVALLFNEVLTELPFLVIFVALLIGTGGNAGSQTVATIIRAITLGEVRMSNLWLTWRREIAVGFLLGVAMGLVGFGFALASTPGDWDTALRMAIVIALSLPTIVMWSTTIATIVPTIADHFHIDPTMISGPMISTIVDATGLAIYYALSGFIFGIY